MTTRRDVLKVAGALIFASVFSITGVHAGIVSPDRGDEYLECLESIVARLRALAALPRDAEGLIMDQAREDACRKEISALMRRSRELMSQMAGRSSADAI